MKTITTALLCLIYFNEKRRIFSLAFTFPTGQQTHLLLSTVSPSSQHSFFHHSKQTKRLPSSLFSELETKSESTRDNLEKSVSTKNSNEKVEMEANIGVVDYAAENKVTHFIKEKILLGIEPKPEILAIMTIYFVEGALGLARLAQTFLLKDQLHLGPAELSALSGIFTLPWTVKPIYGFLSDGFPLFGYRRRSYLVLAGILGGFSYAALGANFWNIFGESSVTVASAASSTTTAIDSLKGSSFGISLISVSIAALTFSSACIAFSDVVADGIVVQRTRDSNDEKVAGGLQSLCWGSAALGGLLSSYFSGSLIESIGPQGVFTLTAVLPLIVASIALLIDEKPVGLNTEDGELVSNMITTPTPTRQQELPIQSINDQISALNSAFKNPGVWKPALFLFLWQSTPTGEGAFLYFMTNDLGFGPEFLGRVRLVTAAAGLVGVWVYQKYLRTVRLLSIFISVLIK